MSLQRFAVGSSLVFLEVSKQTSQGAAGVVQGHSGGVGLPRVMAPTRRSHAACPPGICATGSDELLLMLSAPSTKSTEERCQRASS